MNFKTQDEFKNFVQEYQNQSSYRKPLAFGICRVQQSPLDSNKTLQAVFPVLNWNENFGSFAIFANALKDKFKIENSECVCDIDVEFIKNTLDAFAPFVDEAKGDSHKNIQVLLNIKEYFDDSVFKFVAIFDDVAVRSTECAYLKLFALSLKKVKPREIVLDGVFGALHNVAWSGNNAYDLDYLREKEIELKISNQYPCIDYVDKFPRYLMNIIPEDNVRILDSSKVRFGAYVSAGTTVMPGASYINFNAGTLGSVMVEGRVSSSVIVGAGSDVGGGASILGVLSGTDGNPISIGENCLLGANSTCGVPLGDGCIIDGGITVLAGTKIFISDENIDKINEVNNNALTKGANIYKAKELANMNGLHFRCNSTNGQMIASRSIREIKLNKDLH